MRFVDFLIDLGKLLVGKALSAPPKKGRRVDVKPLPPMKCNHPARKDGKCVTCGYGWGRP